MVESVVLRATWLPYCYCCCWQELSPRIAGRLDSHHCTLWSPLTWTSWAWSLLALHGPPHNPPWLPTRLSKCRMPMTCSTTVLLVPIPPEPTIHGVVVVVVISAAGMLHYQDGLVETVVPFEPFQNVVPANGDRRIRCGIWEGSVVDEVSLLDAQTNDKHKTKH